MRRANQRKTVILDWRMQARVVLGASVPMFACLVVATAAEFLYFQQVRLGNIPSNGTIFGMPEDRLGMLLVFVSAASVQLAMALGVSQKIAGTAYRIRSVLEAFRSGERDARVRLRNADYQLALADDVNEFLDWVASRQAEGSARPPSLAEPERSPSGGPPGLPAAPRETTGQGL